MTEALPYRRPDRLCYLPRPIMQIAGELAGHVHPVHDESVLIHMAIGICDLLYTAGHGSLPSRQFCNERLAKYRRDQAICERFDGHNYGALARRHNVSERTVRRVINHYFYERSET